MDIAEINNTITELENGETTFSNCQKLASLYTVKEHLCADEIEKEFADIIPSYRMYCSIKADYQTGTKSKEMIINSIECVNQEIKEFLMTLYNNTDTLEERLEIKKMLIELTDNLKSI